MTKKTIAKIYVNGDVYLMVNVPYKILLMYKMMDALALCEEFSPDKEVEEISTESYDYLARWFAKEFNKHRNTHYRLDVFMQPEEEYEIVLTLKK